MAMSEENTSFAVFCFHFNQVRFTQSNFSFVEVLFLTTSCAQSINHTIAFFDERTGAHTHTIESTWRHVKAFLNPYNRQEDYIFHFAQYMFAAQCRVETWGTSLYSPTSLQTRTTASLLLATPQLRDWLLPHIHHPSHRLLAQVSPGNSPGNATRINVSMFPHHTLSVPQYPLFCISA